MEGMVPAFMVNYPFPCHVIQGLYLGTLIGNGIEKLVLQSCLFN